MGNVGPTSSSTSSIDPSKLAQIAAPASTSSKPAEKKPAVDLSYEPPQVGPSTVADFYAKQKEPQLSPACAAAVDAGAPLDRVMEACSAREFAIASGTAPQSGLVPVETDRDCVDEYADVGKQIGQATGKEIGDIAKKILPPVVKHWVADKAVEITTRLGEQAGHGQGVADCKKPTNAAAFAATHAPVSSPTTPNASRVPASPVSTDYTPADPAAAVCE